VPDPHLLIQRRQRHQVGIHHRGNGQTPPSASADGWGRQTVACPRLRQ
jgi:hypothetical protein